jgi:TetR/AcrR family fatty acid metabolism transcriptional regulator
MARRDRKPDIMQAVEKLFTSRQFHEITLDDVAKEAKVGKGTIYLHFKDKNDLFFRTATGGFDKLCDLLEKNLADDLAFEDQLRTACEHVIAFFRKKRQLFRMMQSEDARMHWCRGDVREQWRNHRGKLLSEIACIIRKGVEEGKIRKDVDEEVLAGFLLGMLHAATRNLPDSGSAYPPATLAVNLFLSGASRQNGKA